MSVLIKGMDMPRSCDECPCATVEVNEGYYGDMWCGVLSEIVEPHEINTKPSWCPMVEVDEAYFSHRPQKNIYTKLP